MSDLIDRQAALDAIMGQPPEPHYPSWYAAQIKKLPAVQPEDVVGIINDSVDNALTLLDSIYSSGRMMYYSDYCALHDAIAGALAGGTE